MVTRLVKAKMQSEVLCYLATNVCSSAAIGQVAARIVAFIFNPNIAFYLQGILQACSCVGLMTGPPLGGLLFSVSVTNHFDLIVYKPMPSFKLLGQRKYGKKYF